MPYLGLLPFLRQLYQSTFTTLQCFNALPRASSFSTCRKERNSVKRKQNVSMPYLGLLPFLHECSNNPLHDFRRVSMPYLGLLPFLLDRITIRIKKGTVSMPYLGLLPFLRSIIMSLCNSIKCFNALPRASSFSTKWRRYDFIN